LVLEFAKSEWWTSNTRFRHWAVEAKHKKAAREKARRAAESAGLPVFRRAHVTAWIGYPRNGKADPSNVAPVVKAALDGMTDAGVWEDDDSEHVTAVTYRRDVPSGTPGLWRVRLELEEA